MTTSENREGFQLEVPLDASGVKGIRPERAVKIIAVDDKGITWTAKVMLDTKGEGTAALHFEEAPGNLRVMVGPEYATSKQMKTFRGLSVEVPAETWKGDRSLKVPPISISPFYWWWWLSPPRRQPGNFFE